jgi:hypothetical protein
MRLVIALVALPFVCPSIVNAEVVFESDWSTSTGSNYTAVRDGGKWGYSSDPDRSWITVVPADPVNGEDGIHENSRKHRKFIYNRDIIN